MEDVKDSCKPYIEQKHVVLCRSGIQMYHRSELASFITEDNKPAVEKEWYAEYRPAHVVVKAKELFSSLPVTKEHPDCFVDSFNWKTLAGGATDKAIEVVSLDGDAEGEIGLESTITFYDADLYEYYKGNKEVSVGYTCKKHFVKNPDEVGYDIVLDDITEVNHLAITRAGRGGSSVAVIDSLVGGLKPMRTGIFAFLFGNKQNDSTLTFGNRVMEAVKEDNAEEKMKCVLDSVEQLKDSEKKTNLLDTVKDCFDHKDMAGKKEAELVPILDSLYKEAMEISVKGFSSDAKEEEEKAEDTTADEKLKGKETDSKDEEEEEKEEDSCGKKDAEKEEDSVSKDSVSVDSIVDAVKDSIKPIVVEAVKECLGIKDSAKVSGMEVTEEKSVRSYDYASFLD